MPRLLLSNSSSRPTVGTGAKLAGSLFFLFFLGMGAVFAWLVGREAVASLQTWTWPAVDAEIIHANVRETNQAGRNTGEFYLDMEYRYNFQGQVFTSNRHTFKSASFSDYSDAARLAQRYQPGSHATAYINPRMPGIAVLRRRNLFFPLIIFLPMIFVAIGALSIYSLWRPPSAKSAQSPAISDRAAAIQSPAAGLAVMGVFLLLAAGLCYVLLGRPLVRIVTASHWPAVTCTIISSEVKYHRGNRGSTYSVNIFYRYVINDHEYKANRYDFMGGSSSGFARKQAIVAKYPPGSQRTCFVNPNDPTDAVLERGFTPIMWIGLMPLLFVIFGFLGLRSSLRKLRRRTGGAGSFGVGLGAEVPATPVVPGMDTTLHEGPRTLQPRPSPTMKFIAILGIACFWNGIVSVFVFQIIKGWHSGPFEWFLAAFFSIFIVIGLGLIGAVFYCFLALFNPRPRLVINPGIARLGEAIRIDWEIAGRVQILRNLQVRLEGREEASYPSGKNTCTDRSVFADLQIATTSSWQEMQKGDQSITIPATLMHSLAGQHNRIVWSVRVRGEIPRWPDLDEEFPITVLPARGQTSLSKL